MLAKSTLTDIYRGLDNLRARANIAPAKMQIASDVYRSIADKAVIPTDRTTPTVLGMPFVVSPVVPPGFVVFVNRNDEIVGVIDTNAKPNA